MGSVELPTLEEGNKFDTTVTSPVGEGHSCEERVAGSGRTLEDEICTMVFGSRAFSAENVRV